MRRASGTSWRTGCRTIDMVLGRSSFAFALLQQQPSPIGHYSGGASGTTAGHTALAGHLFRFLFSGVPQWIQIAGILIGVPVAIIVVWLVWKRRRRIWGWWLSRRAVARLAIIALIFVVVAGAATSGVAGYTYMMHDNDFCQSCHIMDTAWNRFQVSAHKNIQCHACHRQPLYVSTVELYYWVTQRMMEVPAHDKVPSSVCEDCHMQKGADSILTQVMLTAGHAVHLRSDSSALKDVQCVTCHGRDFHIFIPSNNTCTQSGCHTTIRVNLGAMSKQAFPHCTICHDFKSRVPLSVTVAEAKTRLTPQAIDCFSCHQMTQQIKAFDLYLDPHKGNCGICHEPHKQQQPNEAWKTCAESQCHGSPDTLTAFHRGLAGHVMRQCGSCHVAHSWRLKGANCISCHKAINLDVPLRHTAALDPPTAAPVWLASLSSVAHFASFQHPVARSFPPAALSRPQPVPQDSTFRHSVHKALACTDCHSTTNTHGGLKFTAPAGCLACHHSARQTVECTTCHTTDSLPTRTLPVSFAISARPQPVSRPLTFAHARHRSLACTTCHGSDVRRSVTRTCASCHAEHHTATADCAGCHPTAREGHDRTAHDGCARCHTDPVVAALPPSRPVCLACHQAQRDHYPTGDCATCHALTNVDMMSAGRPHGGT